MGRNESGITKHTTEMVRSDSKRLCAYEDTGLDPEEITALIADNKRLHELVDIIENTIKAL